MKVKFEKVTDCDYCRYKYNCYQWSFENINKPCQKLIEIYNNINRFNRVINKDGVFK